MTVAIADGRRRHDALAGDPATVDVDARRRATPVSVTTQGAARGVLETSAGAKPVLLATADGLTASSRSARSRRAAATG